jgi:hypothetical protein
MFRQIGGPDEPISISEINRNSGVNFSRDSTRVYIGLSRPASQTAIAPLDQPGRRVVRLDGVVRGMSTDGRLALVERDEVASLVRLDGAVVAPRHGARLWAAAFLERGVVLVQERDGRWSLGLYDPDVDRETTLLEQDRVVIEWTSAAGGSGAQAGASGLPPYDVTLVVRTAPDGRSFVAMVSSADNPPPPANPYYYGRTIRRGLRLYSATGELLVDFGSAVYGCNSTAALYGPTGRQLLIARSGGQSLLLDLDTGRRQQVPPSLFFTGYPPPSDISADGTLWSFDLSGEQARSGLWTETAGLREVEPPEFMSLSPSGRYALTGHWQRPAAVIAAAVVAADGSARWPLPASAALGWSGQVGVGPRHLFGLSCGI